MFQSPNYDAARARAEDAARTYNRPMGLERATEYGKTVYRVKMIPADPNKRQGWELSCEVVDVPQAPTVAR